MRCFVTVILFSILITVLPRWMLTASVFEKSAKDIKVIVVSVNEQKLYSVDELWQTDFT